MKIQAIAASAPKQKLNLTTVEIPRLKPDEVLIQVESCGICHSDLSMLNNDWGITSYPFVPGHEIIGTIVEMGSEVKARQLGTRVGLGWFTRSCLACPSCNSGDQNLCGVNEQTIVGRHGGFSTHVIAQWNWTCPLPAELDPLSAGPLFCGGITVFNPIVQNNIKPTDRVGVVGIGGLGHLALQFLNKWGCEVTAFTSNPAKAAEAKSLGAHHTITSNDEAALAKAKGIFNFILVTANVTLPWQPYMDALSPKGRLHFVGAVLEPVPLAIFPLIVGQKSVSGSPLGSPGTTLDMINFCARHKIKPQTEIYKMSEANKALEHLESGKARYRIVLEADLG